MLNRKYYLHFTLLVIFLFGSIASGKAAIREPVWAGRFYPANEVLLKTAIKNYSDKAQNTKTAIPEDRSLKALIMPHAGYIYSGFTAAHASLVLSKKSFDTVILMGPDHRVGFSNAAISDVTSYKTPLGRINLHPFAKELRERSDIFHANPASDKTEHSLEVILPFLQYYLSDFSLIPIVIGSGANASAIAEKISPMVSENILLVASSDLSHYLPYEQAVVTDRETIETILRSKIELLLKNNNRACGAKPILAIIELARRNGWQPVLLHYSNSGDTAGNRDKVVGYTTIAFYGEQKMNDTKNRDNDFNRNQGLILTQLARLTIAKKLGAGVDPDEQQTVAEALRNPIYDKHHGVFVTLHKHGQLRGCIGSISGIETVRDGIARNAINAAFNDHRFKPLNASELEQIDIEVSILSEPIPLSYKNGADLLKKLTPQADGVILKKGFANATFLPQVWDQLPKKEDFLSRLCMKAGLPANAWQTEALEVQTYQVQHFNEEK